MDRELVLILVIPMVLFSIILTCNIVLSVMGINNSICADLLMYAIIAIVSYYVGFLISALLEGLDNLMNYIKLHHKN